MPPPVSRSGHPRCCHHECQNYAHFAAFNPLFPGHLTHLCAAHVEAVIHANPGQYFYLALTPLHSREVLTLAGRTRAVNLEPTMLEKLDAEQARQPTRGYQSKVVVHTDGTPADKPKVKEFQTWNGWGAVAANPGGVGLHVGNPGGVGLTFQPQAEAETKDHVPVKTAPHEFSPLTGWCYHCGVSQSHQLAGKPCPRVA